MKDAIEPSGNHSFLLRFIVFYCFPSTPRCPSATPLFCVGLSLSTDVSFVFCPIDVSLLHIEVFSTFPIPKSLFALLASLEALILLFIIVSLCVFLPFSDCFHFLFLFILIYSKIYGAFRLCVSWSTCPVIISMPSSLYFVFRGITFWRS